ncbi:response regulator [Ornithinibacillus bavariensis]|uniref:DNA-binding response regulator n=1 Tax=Ornithinibacillus bavariensis TaxID=545502 RepID=A0A919XCH9_9BACI|nr:response regulator transcription factor [Ornithinibacillus bavariensis]GIO28038.1 DNA-binding response regulator [Ornithinibacillus bavariensis]
MKKVLVVEDETKLAMIIHEFLKDEGYEVEVAADGLRALQLAAKINPDIVLLDWMLPELSGIEVCRKLREMGQYGIIMITAKAEETDKIIGLGVGADDYMVKPFSLREMSARIQSLLRRMSPLDTTSDTIRSFGSLVISPVSHQVRLDGKEIMLTPTEYKILEFLSASPSQVFSREQILQHVFNDEEIMDVRTVDAHISKLRKKVNGYIQTVYGFGYRFGVNDEH